MARAGLTHPASGTTNGQARLAALAVVLLAALIALAGCEEKPQMKAGQTKADFTLLDSEGRTVKLADYRGKVVMLEFWATWCPSCKDSIPELIELNERYADQGFVLLSISLDKLDSDVHAFLAERPLPYPVLMGGKTDIDDQYGVSRIPVSFLIGRDGTVVTKHLGGMPMALADKIEKLLKG
jgi:peroxiredoxin